METNATSGARRGVWRVRRLRLTTGANVLAAAALAAAVFVLVNVLSSHFHRRWDISWRRYYRLSPKTLSLLGSLDADVRAIAFFRESRGRFDDVKYLLREYQHAAAVCHGLSFAVEFVDPDRDVVRAGELAQQYGLTEDGVVVFECGGRRKFVEDKEIFERQVEVQGDRAYRRLVAFRGEQAFSSAIQSVTQDARPVVYVLGGHGERVVEDFGKHSGGYSLAARAIARDNMEVRTLLLAEPQGIPADCTVLVVAGPSRRLSQAEVDMIGRYLDKSGRLFYLQDSGTASGLEPLLAKWGVRVGNDVVAGMTLTGKELVVSAYGSHPITRGFANVATMFYRPRSMEPAADSETGGTGDPVDRPRVTVLASSEKGWADADLAQQPPHFDDGVDRPGPIAVAVAVERGPVKGLDVVIKPTRVVAVGDSAFVSNGALSSGVGGNLDFFMSALNWLVEREALLAVAPKPPNELRLDMNGRQIRTAYGLMVVGGPGLIAAAGLVVWWRRRR